MAGFLPANDSTEQCKQLIIKQSELADRLGIKVTPVMVVLDPAVHTFLGSVPPDKISLHYSNTVRGEICFKGRTAAFFRFNAYHTCVSPPSTQISAPAI
jgi:hypothetical protein